MDNPGSEKGSLYGVGDRIFASNAEWTFGGSVVEAFDEHIEKSIPFYREGHDLIARLSDSFVRNGSLIYEVGSSTGELIRKVANRHPRKSASFVGVDREGDMVLEARKRSKDDPRIQFLASELVDFSPRKCDLILSYYTIQFVAPEHRQELLNRFYESLQKGGALILFEKVRAPDARFQDLMTQVYTEYKLDRGYSADEILSKNRSLKGVLDPFTSEENFHMLHQAGFQKAMSIMKYVSFEGVLAIK